MSTYIRISALILTFLILSCLGQVAQIVNAQTISIALPDTFVTETQSVMIPIQVSDVSSLGIISFDITISFDPSIIEIIDIKTLEGIASGFFFSNNLNLAGKAAIAAASIDSLKGAGTLFYLQANFLKDGSSEMNFDRVDFEVDSVDVVAQNGRLRNISLASVNKAGENPTQLLLSHNYPNPFSTTSTISMDLPEAAQVFVELYNISGQLEVSYPSRPIAAGTKQLVTIEASSLPTGAYYYRIIAHSTGITRYGTGALTIIH